jgi:hypothetical protein
MPSRLGLHVAESKVHEFPRLEVAIGGLLTGMLYSLVALGFVLIFKAWTRSTSPRARCGALTL